MKYIERKKNPLMFFPESRNQEFREFVAPRRNKLVKKMKSTNEGEVGIGMSPIQLEVLLQSSEKKIKMKKCEQDLEKGRVVISGKKSDNCCYKREEKKREEKKKRDKKTLPGTKLKDLKRDFLMRPGPCKDLLIKERTTELYTNMVLKTRRVRQLERQLDGRRPVLADTVPKGKRAACSILGDLRGKLKDAEAREIVGLILKLEERERAVRKAEEDVKRKNRHHECMEKSLHETQSELKDAKATISDLRQSLKEREHLLNVQRKNMDSFGTAYHDILCTVKAEPEGAIEGESALRRSFNVITVRCMKAERELAKTVARLKESEQKIRALEQVSAAFQKDRTKSIRHKSRQKTIFERDLRTSGPAKGGSSSTERRRSIRIGTQLMANLEKPVVEQVDSEKPDIKFNDLSEFEQILRSTVVQEVGDGGAGASVESQAVWNLARLSQMRHLLEMLKLIHIDVIGELQKSSSSVVGAESRAEKYLANVVTNYAGECFLSEYSSVYIYEEDTESFWSPTLKEMPRKNLPLDPKEDAKNPAISPLERRVVRHAYNNRAPVHVTPVKGSDVLNCSLLAVPIFGEGTKSDDSGRKRNVLGVLVVSKKRAPKEVEQEQDDMRLPFTEFDEALLWILSDHIGSLIGRIHEKHRLEVRARLESALVKSAGHLLCDYSKDPPLLFAERLGEQCKNLVFGNCARVYLREFNLDGTLSRKMWTISSAKRLSYLSLVEDESIAANAILNGCSTMIDDVNRHDVYNPNVDLCDKVYRGGPLICVPIWLPRDAKGLTCSWLAPLGQDRLLLGCVQVQLPLRPSSKTASKSVCEAARILEAFLCTIAPQVDLMWQSVLQKANSS